MSDCQYVCVWVVPYRVVTNLRKLIARVLLCSRTTSPDVSTTSIAEVPGVSSTTSEQQYVSQYETVTSSMTPASSSQSSFEASVWQQYRYYQNQFYRNQPYLPPQYSHQYTADVAEPPHYHSPAWLHPHAHHYHPGQHQQSQLHLADGVGITPAYHHFREMNGLCCYDSVY